MGCNPTSKEKPTTNNNPLTQIEKPVNFRFFYRDERSNNYYNTYDDILVIEKFSPSKLCIAELVDFTVKYRDTAKTEYPISRIDLLGEIEKDHFELSKAILYDYYKYMVLAIDFENVFEKNKNKKHPVISSLTIWKGNQLSKDFENASIDSLIKANPTLDNLWKSLGW